MFDWIEELPPFCARDKSAELTEISRVCPGFTPTLGLGYRVSVAPHHRRATHCYNKKDALDPLHSLASAGETTATIPHTADLRSSS